MRRAFSLLAMNPLRKSPETVLAMARKPKKLSDYISPEEASALGAAAPNYQVRMAMRIMLWTGLRGSERLSLRPADLRLTQDLPILSLKPDAPGNNAKRGREAPVPVHLVESLTDLKSFHRRARNRPLSGINRLWVSRSMKLAAAESFMAFSSSVNLWAKSVCRQSSGGWSSAKLDCLLSLTASSA